MEPSPLSSVEPPVLYCTGWHVHGCWVRAQVDYWWRWCGCVISGQSRLKNPGRHPGRRIRLSLPDALANGSTRDAATLLTFQRITAYLCICPNPDHPQPKSSWRLDWGEKGSPPARSVPCRCQLTRLSILSSSSRGGPCKSSCSRRHSHPRGFCSTSFISAETGRSSDQALGKKQV
jgi:hypothetical protein